MKLSVFILLYIYTNTYIIYLTCLYTLILVIMVWVWNIFMRGYARFPIHLRQTVQSTFPFQVLFFCATHCLFPFWRLPHNVVVITIFIFMTTFNHVSLQLYSRHFSVIGKFLDNKSKYCFSLISKSFGPSNYNHVQV